jgi:hypothetical protein
MLGSALNLDGNCGVVGNLQERNDENSTFCLQGCRNNTNQVTKVGGSNISHFSGKLGAVGPSPSSGGPGQYDSSTFI